MQFINETMELHKYSIVKSMVKWKIQGFSLLNMIGCNVRHIKPPISFGLSAPFLRTINQTKQMDVNAFRHGMGYMQTNYLFEMP